MTEAPPPTPSLLTGESEQPIPPAKEFEIRYYDDDDPHFWDDDKDKDKDKKEDKEEQHKLRAVSQPIFLPFWVRIIGRSSLLWEATMCTLSLWINLHIIFNIMFSFQDQTYHGIINVLDVIFGVDMTLQLLVQIWRRQTRAQFLVFCTQYTLLQGLIDFVSFIPIDRLYLIASGTDHMSSLEILDWLRLNRLLRTFRAKRLFDTLKLTLRVNEKVIYFSRFLYMYLVYVHVFMLIIAIPCGVTYLDWRLYRAKVVVDNEPNSCFWTHRFSKGEFVQAEKKGEPPYPVQLYAYALEFIALTLTTVGLGDIFPLGAKECSVMLGIMTIGAVWLGGELSSNLIDFQIEQDAARFDLFYRLKCIRNIYSRVRCPPSFLVKVEEFYASLWNYRQGMHTVDLARLPEALRQEILLDICSEMFYKSTFFRGLEEAFLRSLSKKVHIGMYSPDMILCKQGSPSFNMYYVIQGELSMSARCNEGHTAGIIRPGCVIGEMNVLFSCPYEMQICTMTTCQLLVLAKSDLLDELELYPFAFEDLIKRFRLRRTELYHSYRLVGKRPVNYTVRVKENTAQDKARPVSVRYSTGFNRLEHKDVIDDSVETYILSMPCPDKKFAKDHTTSYSACRILPIFTMAYTLSLLRAYNFFIIVYVAGMCLIVPYCAGYDVEGPGDNKGFCVYLFEVQFLANILALIDLIVEIIFASPATGIRFKLTDGFKIKCRLVTFWFDVYAVIPYGMFMQPPFHWIPLVTQLTLKFYKILRYLSYLDESYPFDLLLLRFLKFVILLCYAIHYTACYLFWIANGNINDIEAETWMDSYYVARKNRPELRGDQLRERGPYIYPFFFASSILTTVGHGGFHPQTLFEMFSVVVIAVGGLVLVSYCMSGLTSALHCKVRPELKFNQKLVGIEAFLNHLGVGEKLFARIIEHYTLQNQLTQGVILDAGQTNLLYDAPGYLSDDASIYLTDVYLEGVPLFTKVDAEIVKQVSNRLTTYLLPPGITFVRKGEVRRQLYIIARGSVGMMLENDIDDPEELVDTLTSTGYFGIRDLLFAEPCQFKTVTLSYVQLFVLDYMTFREAFSHEIVLTTIINSELNNAKADIVDMPTDIYAEESKDTVKKVSSWIKFPYNSNQTYPHCTYFEYQAPFKPLRLGLIVKFFLMRRTLHPVGKFLKFWVLFVSLVAVANLIMLFIETFMGFRAPGLRIIQFTLDVLSWTDIYVKLHCGYYTSSNLLITHPLRTATHYVYEGLFFYDVCFTVPFEFVTTALGTTDFFGYGIGATWYTKMRWGRALQIYKLHPAFVLIHTIFKNRMVLLGTLYVFITISVSAIVGAIASYVGCPWHPRIWQDGDQYKLPLCPVGSWARANDEFTVNQDFLHRFILSLYFSVQSVVLIGFGDLVQPNEDEMLFLAIIVILGCFLIQFIIADLTAAQVDSNETRANFEERRRCVLSIFHGERLPSIWINPIGEHLNYQWDQSRGLQPAQLFKDVHPALETELFREIIGDRLSSILIFENMHEAVIRSLCELIRKEYFLRGERITRLGNLEYEMFILVEGSVYIVDKTLEWQCTLNEGEYFGEIGMLYGWPRKYSAIAASNVAAFVLNSDDFSVLLDLYPSLREKITHMMSTNRQESYEKKINKLKELAQTDEHVREKADARTAEVKEHFKSRGLDTGLYQIEEPNAKSKSKGKRQKKVTRWGRFKKKIIGYGSRDRDLPFLYFATNKKRFKFLLHPKCSYIKYQNKLVMMACYFSPAFALYSIIFVDDVMEANLALLRLHVTDLKGDDIFRFFSLIMESIMLWNILLRFITPFQLPGGFFCKSHWKIILNYITSPTLFFVDIITVFPYYLFGKALTPLILLRFLRLIHFYREIYARREDLEISIFRFRLSISGSFLLLCAHINACIFYYIACDLNTRICSEDSWVQIFTEVFLDHSGISKQAVLNLSSPSHWYLRSLYWVVSIYTTIGYGDIHPNNVKEYFVCILSMVFGFFGLTIIVGNISTGLAALKGTEGHYLSEIRRLVNHLASVGLSRERQELLKAYSLYLWQSGRGESYHKAFSILPLSTRFDASYLIYGHVLQSCSFFGGINDICFYRNVSVRLHHAIFLPGSQIASENEYGDKLFIIFKGRVGAYRRNQSSGQFDYHSCYTIGEAFGRIPALFLGAAYNKMYRAERNTEVLILAQKDISRLCRYYPKWKKFIAQIIRTKYWYLLNDMEHLFSKDKDQAPPPPDDSASEAESIIKIIGENTQSEMKVQQSEPIVQTEGSTMGLKRKTNSTGYLTTRRDSTSSSISRQRIREVIQRK